MPPHTSHDPSPTNLAVHPDLFGVPVTALMLTTSDEDGAALEHLLRRAGWSLDTVATSHDAVRRASSGEVPILIADIDTAGGQWQSLVETLHPLPRAPRFIVSSRLADERLWAEALNLGAFDLISKPFESREVYHVLTHAWTSWHDDGARAAARSIRKAPQSAMSAGAARNRKII